MALEEPHPHALPEIHDRAIGTPGVEHVNRGNTGGAENPKIEDWLKYQEQITFYLAVRGSGVAHEQAEQGRFPRSVVPEHGEERSSAGVQGDVFEHGRVRMRIGVGEAARVQGSCAHIAFGHRLRRGLHVRTCGCAGGIGCEGFGKVHRRYPR